MGYDDEARKISVDTYRKTTNDTTSSNEEIEDIINNIQRLSSLVYDILNEE